MFPLRQATVMRNSTSNWPVTSIIVGAAGRDICNMHTHTDTHQFKVLSPLQFGAHCFSFFKFLLILCGSEPL